ncbi:MAG: protein kinase domain-containing protein [Candidatus Sericytochromatia bacterium]
MHNAEHAEDVELTLISDLPGTAQQPAPPQSGPPRYNMLGSVGQGAMGEILLAQDQGLRRKVAFKQIHTTMAANPKISQRFLTEAQITAQLDHPNIVPIYSLEATPNGSIGYSMKLIQGKTFKELIQEARTQWDQTGRFAESHTPRHLFEHFLKVCDAIHYSHNKGVIHRDLKPANIMVGAYNEVYVMDWGIAKIITQPEAQTDPELSTLIQSDAQEPEMERTQLGLVMGTPRYMSPQQAAGKNNELDGRCDQFSLGLILFELATLQPAFRASSQVDLLKKVLKVELEPMLSYAGNKPLAPELQAIIRKATGKKVAQRYASVADMAEDLRRFLRGDAVLARPDNLWQKVLRWVGHHREITLGLMLALALLGSGTVIWSLVKHQAAMRQAQANEQKLSHFLLQVGQRAQVIDSRFKSFEALLERLAASTVRTLEMGQPQPGQVYTHLDFAQATRRPPDYRRVPSYGLDLSLEHASYKISPGLTRAQLEPLMQTLLPIHSTMREVMLASHSQDTPFLPPAEATRLLREQGAPLIWIFMGFKQGLLINYPGNTGYADAYDARQRPWYTSALKYKGPHWQTPYIDTSGKGMVLPCNMALYDSQQQFLGVAAIEMTLEYIKNQFLEIRDLPGVVGSYLIDAQGQVLVSSHEKNQDFAVGTLVNQARELEKYAHPELIPAFQTQQPGYHEFQHDQQNRVLAYYPLRALGWTYLVEADAAQLSQK